MTVVLDLRPRLRASRERRLAPPSADSSPPAAGEPGPASAELLAAAAALGFASIAEMFRYWRKLNALAETWADDALPAARKSSPVSWIG